MGPMNFSIRTGGGDKCTLHAQAETYRNVCVAKLSCGWRWGCGSHSNQKEGPLSHFFKEDWNGGLGSLHTTYITYLQYTPARENYESIANLSPLPRVQMRVEAMPLRSQLTSTILLLVLALQVYTQK